MTATPARYWPGPELAIHVEIQPDRLADPAYRRAVLAQVTDLATQQLDQGTDGIVAVDAGGKVWLDPAPLLLAIDARCRAADTSRSELLTNTQRQQVARAVAAQRISDEIADQLAASVCGVPLESIYPRWDTHRTPNLYDVNGAA